MAKKSPWLKLEHYKGYTVYVSKVTHVVTGKPVYGGVVIEGKYKSPKAMNKTERIVKEIFNGKNKEEVVKAAKRFIDNPNSGKYEKGYPIKIRKYPPK